MGRLKVILATIVIKILSMALQNGKSFKKKEPKGKDL